ncbi:TorF family putative porin [Sphingomonas sp. LM7]|uniref:TorF family putative porin n=1 Tax=Sphingomonas sp. LM7 TaxID=1938607 RepID=UPI000983FA32|nr:TorF family putative porin [Sphingomonas sp. LM7]AQR74108.1 hypothetical protein BXU08_11000 [Sphingomonas sp. LM7]
MRTLVFTTILIGGITSLPAQAQRLTGGIEAATDESRRGLSWSEGRIATSADLLVPFGPLEASARVATVRDSVRHDGAEVVADLELGAVTDLGPFRVRGHVTGHVFAGARSRMDYIELGGSGSYSLGPVQLNAGAVYAPDQSAIGGSNLYLYAGANAGVPMTPLSASAAIGRSSGDTDDPIRAARLRPTGTYNDWRIGLEYNSFPITFGLDYVGTDIENRPGLSPFADARHSGDRLIGRARISF